jgi:hypothetical protein
MKYILLFILLLPFVYSVNCQYTELESYTVNHKMSYVNDYFIGEDIKSDEIFSYSKTGYSIRINNTVNANLEVNISYNRYSKWLGVNQNVNEVYIIGGNDYHIIDDAWLKRVAAINADKALRDIRVKLSDRLRFDLRDEIEVRNRSICTGLLDDGSKCDFSAECGSGLCFELAGYCGTNISVIEDDPGCPSGEFLCSDRCVEPSVLNSGEVYFCEEQCALGLKGCDGICKNSSSIIEGESYTCEWECKSDRFENGICLESTGHLYGKWLGLGFALLLIGILVIKLYHSIKINKAKEVARKLVSEAVFEANEKRKIAAIIELKIEILSKSLDKALVNNLEDAREKKEQLKKLNQSLTKISEDTEKKEYKIIKMYKDLLVARYGKNLIYDDNGYPRFKDSNKLIHRVIYENEKDSKIKWKNQIHHIDANKINIEVKNLIELTSQQHKNIPHSKIPTGDWKKGMEVLMKTMKWKENDLPDHLKEEWEKRKQ